MSLIEILKYIAWGLAFFFAGSWTIGLLIRRDFRLSATMVAVANWWCQIVFALISAYSPLHLLWLMPVTLLVSGAVTQADIRTTGGSSFASVATKSALIIWPIWGILIYFSP